MWVVTSDQSTRQNNEIFRFHDDWKGESELETNRWSPRCSIAHTFRVYEMQLCKGNDQFSFLRWYAAEKAHSERTHRSTIDSCRPARTGTKTWSTGCPTTLPDVCFQSQIIIEKITCFIILNNSNYIYY